MLLESRYSQPIVAGMRIRTRPGLGKPANMLTATTHEWPIGTADARDVAVRGPGALAGQNLQLAALPIGKSAAGLCLVAKKLADLTDIGRGRNIQVVDLAAGCPGRSHADRTRAIAMHRSLIAAIGRLMSELSRAAKRFRLA